MAKTNATNESFLLSKYGYWITELTLHNKCFVAEPRSEPDLRHVGSFVDEIFDAMEHSSTGGGDTTVNTTLGDRLTYAINRKKKP